MPKTPEENFFDCDMRFEDRESVTESQQNAKEILDFICEMSSIFEAGFNHIPTMPQGLNVNFNQEQKRIELIIDDAISAKIVTDAFLHEVEGNPEKFRMKSVVAKAGARLVIITTGPNQTAIDVYPKTGREKKEIKGLQKRSGENPLRTKTRHRLTEVVSKIHKGDLSDLNIETSNPRRLISKRLADVLSRYKLTSYEPKGEMVITKLGLNED